MRCRCGKEAVGCFLKPTSIFAGIKEVKERESACQYHLDKAKLLGYHIEEMAVIC